MMETMMMNEWWKNKMLGLKWSKHEDLHFSQIMIQNIIEDI